MAKTLRLIFPQWQGGEMHNIAGYVSELEPQEAMQGYCLGAHLLNWPAPKAQEGDSVCAIVPVSLDNSAGRAHRAGYFCLPGQQKAARERPGDLTPPSARQGADPGR